MSYYAGIASRAGRLTAWLDMKKEQGADADALARSAEATLSSLIGDAERLAPCPELAAREPDDLRAIRALRPKGPRVIRTTMSDDKLADRLMGAWLGRSAGCILGIPCEGMSREDIATACKSLGQKYPLNDYWRLDPKPTRASGLHYGVTPRERFLKPKLRYVGADDDLIYTLLGLLILEDYGIGFTPKDVGKAWVRYLPIACTAERVALDNLKAGMTPPDTALSGNPYAEWIGADIRSDPWGYAAPGCPEAAAEFAWRDAVVSHVRNGIYGEMYFSAVIAAALAAPSARPAESVEESLRAGLAEIPRQCRMAATVKETLRWCKRDGEWRQTVDRILKRYAGMSRVHTLNNAALTLAGLMYGQGGFGETVGLTVMAGQDTDCTGATAGSVLGAILGAKGLPARWRKPLGKSAETYLIGHRRFLHTVVVRRFVKVAKKVRSACGL